MRSQHVSVAKGNQFPGLEETYSPPERSLTTPWLESNGRFFRINLTIVGPVTEEPESYLLLSCSKSEDILKTLSNEIILFEKQLPC